MGKLSQRNHTLLIFHILLTSLIYPDFQRILSALAHHFIIGYLHSHALHLHIRFTCLFIPQWNLRGNKVYTAAMGGTSVEGLVVPKPGGISIPGGGAISPASTSFSNTFRGLCKSIKEPWHKKLNEMQQRMFCYDVIPMFLQSKILSHTYWLFRNNTGELRHRA